LLSTRAPPKEKGAFEMFERKRRARVEKRGKKKGKTLLRRYFADRREKREGGNAGYHHVVTKERGITTAY